MAYTLSQLRTILRNRWAGENRASAVAIQDQSCNLAPLHLAGAHDWVHLYKRGRINLQPGYETGTVAVTQDSPNVTLTGGTFPTTATAMRIFITGEDIDHGIATRTDGTHVILDATEPYNGATASGLTYKMYQREYPVPADFLRLPELLSEESAGALTYIPPERMLRKEFEVYESTGAPRYWTINNDQFVVDFPPDERIAAPFLYIRQPTALVLATDVLDWPDKQFVVFLAAADFFMASAIFLPWKSIEAKYQELQIAIRHAKAFDARVMSPQTRRGIPEDILPADVAGGILPSRFTVEGASSY